MSDETGPAKTFAEQLDDAENGKEFRQVINNLFRFLEKAKDSDG